GMGMVRLAQNSPVEAQANFKQAIETNSGNSTAHFGLGKVYLSQGQVDAAIKEFNIALYQFPNSAPVRLALGEAYLQQGNTAAAKGITRAYYLKATKDASGAYFMSNDFAQANQMLEKAVALNPNDMELRLAQAKLRTLSGETVDLKSVGEPKTDGERVAYAEA